MERTISHPPKGRACDSSNLVDDEVYLLDQDKFKLIENQLAIAEFAEKSEHLNLSDLKFSYSNIIEVKTVEELGQVRSAILASPVVGVDCEFISSIIPFEAADLYLMQIATKDHCYIIYIGQLKDTSEIKAFCKDLFENDEIKKIGFSLKDDLHHLIQTLDMPQIYIKVFFDLADIYDDLYGEQVSLSVLIKKYFGKELDKSEQCSDWSSASLRQSQVVYAALDAVVLVRAFDIIDKLEEFSYEIYEDNGLIKI